MPKKIQCNLTKEELEILYYKEGLTQKQLAPILGVKSDITVRKILHIKKKEGDLMDMYSNHAEEVALYVRVL